MNETIHFYNNNETTLCGLTSSAYINAVVEYPTKDFCLECVDKLKMDTKKVIVCDDLIHIGWIRQIVDQQIFCSNQSAGPDYTGEKMSVCPFCGHYILANQLEEK